MFGALALALLGSPFVTLPMPAVTGDPMLVALAADPARLRLHCLSLRCGDAEWRRALEPPRPLRRPAALPWREPRAPLPGSQRWIALWAPATPRRSRASYANDWRVGARFQLQALRDGPTRLGLRLGAGYRLAPLHDDGIRRPGPVLRGGFDFGQRLGERAQWSQRVQFETGHGVTFVKQTLGLDVSLSPAWTFEADFAIRHYSQDDSGEETAESWMGLRRRF